MICFDCAVHHHCRSLQVLRPIRQIASPPTQKLLECLSELWTEDCVDDGVESGIEITKPQEEAGYKAVYAALAQWADCIQKVIAVII